MRTIRLTAYINNRKSELNNQEDAVRDYSVFDFTYIPPEPFMRQEAKPIIDAILRYEQTGIPKNLALFGSRGCGKTLIVSYLARHFQKETALKLPYCNVRNHNTSFKILAHLLGARAK